MARQRKLPGFELPGMHLMDERDQHTLYYLCAKGGAMQPLPRTNYDPLIERGFVVRRADGMVALTPDGEALLDREFENQRIAGATWHD